MEQSRDTNSLLTHENKEGGVSYFDSHYAIYGIIFLTISVVVVYKVMP